MLNRIPDFPNREKVSHNTDDLHKTTDTLPVPSDMPDPTALPPDTEDEPADHSTQNEPAEEEATTTDPQAALKALQEQARQMGGFVYIPEDTWTVSLQGTETRTPPVPPLESPKNHHIPEQDSIDESEEMQAEQTREDRNTPSSPHKGTSPLRKIYGRLRWTKDK